MAFSRGDARIVVRPLAAADAPALFREVRASMQSLSRWMPWCHPGYSLADAEAWVAHCVSAWEARSEFPLGIFSSQDGGLLGGAGLNRVDASRRSANLGYWVGERHRGSGVATSAAAMAAAIGFEDLGFARLEIVTLPDNRASQRVATRLGARRAGEFPGRLSLGGKPVPAIVYVLARQVRDPAGG